jgi:2,5-diamino-6-(ribosylamino)-4(3H)-pyrimidinone 5'-phosphate reductase
LAEKKNSALRLHPLPPREMSAHRIYEDLELPPSGRRASRRPYVLINMVSSLDGRTTVEGKALSIGSETDRQVMRTLRSKADAVMIGANTLRAERLSLGLDEPARSQPIAVILTNTGNLPLERHLIRHELQKVLVLVPESGPAEEAIRELGRCGDVLVLGAPTAQGGAIDLGAALEVLKDEHGVGLLLVEGGPTLNHALISGGLADELFLTLAPKLLAGSSREELTILEGQPLPQALQEEEEQKAPPAKLLSVHLAVDELFLRYKVQR